MAMIWILPPVIAILMVIGCLLINGMGLESLGDPVVLVATIFLLAMCCMPLLRRAMFTFDQRNKASETHQWLTRMPWLDFAMIWNGLGALFALYLIIFIILYIQYSINLPDPPTWCMIFFFWLWFLPMPITNLGAIVVLWRSRTIPKSRVLILYSIVIFVLWSSLILMFVSYNLP